MAVDMKGKHIITLHDLSTEEIEQILKTAEILKIKQYSNEPHRYLEGKTLGMIFEKPSLRTKVSFEVGMNQLGGSALYLGPDEIKMGKRESVEDVAIVLSRYVDAIMARTFSHKVVEELAKYSRVPVINGLSDFSHPCQALADFFTMKEKKGNLKGLKLVFVGDGNNVATSLMFGSAKLGMEFVIATPKGYELSPEVVAMGQEDAKSTGATITLSNNPMEAVFQADVIYTDVWTSMGQESEKEERIKAFKDFQVNMELLERAKKDCIVMHCLPAHYGEEITYDVVKDKRSVIYDQAENRLHAQKAILSLVIR